MRQTCIFSGSSHPSLVGDICERLGQKQADVDLRKFANGETSVEISQSPCARLPVITALLTPPCRDFSP
jgi:phosphoribosylpyrophosphate synthetase